MYNSLLGRNYVISVTNFAVYFCGKTVTNRALVLFVVRKFLKIITLLMVTAIMN